MERHFNPRSREESDDEYEQYTLFSVAFQSTLPRGERLYKCSWQLLHEYFNPRSREGSDYSADCSDLSDGYFNPRSREGSDINDANGSEGVSISIHAPARGATKGSRFQSFRKFISIHAPARGATRFNYAIYFCFYISIHAPARGATLTEVVVKQLPLFQSTLPRGERPVRILTRGLTCRFQSTLPRGERQELTEEEAAAITISIHAPARGAT